MWRHHLKLNFVVFIWSFTAILGQWITLPRFELVFLRTFFAGIILLVIWKGLEGRDGRCRRWPRRFWRLYFNGAIVGFHWVLFFAAAKMNASVLLAGLATTTLWTALLEPLLTSARWKRSEIALGAIITVALLQISRAEADHLVPLLLGVASAIAAAIFAILNGQWARGEDAIGVTILEMAGASSACFISLLVLSAFDGNLPQFALTPMDWVWMAILVIFCTAYAYVAYVKLLEYLSVFTINLAANFEPVYGMILAAVLLGEADDLSLGFYLGSGMILICVLVHTWMMKRDARQRS